jgi:hypothetical protein
MARSQANDALREELRMFRGVAAALGATALAAAALPAGAQDDARRERPAGDPSITLYELPDYAGRSITFYADVENLAAQSFNDRARSARIQGAWRLCGDSNYRNRCEPFASDVRDLGAYGFDSQISSLQQVGGRPGRPGFQGPAILAPRIAGRDGVEGRAVVFYRRPSLNGVDVIAQGQNSADAFCREVGLGVAIYFDDRQRVRQAIDSDGRSHSNVPALRDVLCRRA